MSDNAPAAATTPTAPTLTVKYNHQSRTLTADEAAAYAQMGMKYEAMQPTLDRLGALAASRRQTLDQYVTAAEADAQRALLAAATAETGDPAAAAAQVAEQTLAAETTRLREQMTELAEAGVGITDLQDLPAAAREDARQNGRTLLDAYLRHQWHEQQAVAAEAAAAATAANAALGSQSAPPPTDSADSLTHAMVRGLHSVL